MTPLWKRAPTAFALAADNLYGASPCKPGRPPGSRCWPFGQPISLNSIGPSGPIPFWRERCIGSRNPAPSAHLHTAMKVKILPVTLSQPGTGFPNAKTFPFQERAKTQESFAPPDRWLLCAARIRCGASGVRLRIREARERCAPARKKRHAPDRPARVFNCGFGGSQGSEPLVFTQTGESKIKFSKDLRMRPEERRFGANLGISVHDAR